MARRRKTSAAEDVVEIVSRLPWWVGCVLAVFSYVGLHMVAGIEVAKPTGVSGLGSFAGKQLYVTLASFGQYVFPILFGFGALGSFIRSAKQKERFDHVRSQPDRAVLFDMTWQQFETLVNEFFRRRGYSVKQTGGNGPDGGVDLIASKGSDRYFVQCKQWKAYKVGVQTVRELYGVMSAQGAAGGFVITAGEFTEEAKKFVGGLNIRLFDGSHLHKMIRGSGKETNVHDNRPIQPSNFVPQCPKCGKSLVRRVTNHGRHAGREFWGCSGFPSCRHTASIN
ncbi:MAG: restriction endonuclease [Pedobacter sp.]